jgi:hypothetical protein
LEGRASTFAKAGKSALPFRMDRGTAEAVPSIPRSFSLGESTRFGRVLLGQFVDGISQSVDAFPSLG